MNVIKNAVLLLVCILFAGCATKPQWYRGNTHTHTFWSDGKEFPETVAARYKEAGYHFLALSDHNVVSRGERWKNANAKGMESAIAAADARWGKDHLQWRDTDGKRQVRLMPLDEVRGLVEEPGQFVVIESVELTAAQPSGQQVHSNPINISKPLRVNWKSSNTVEEELALHEELVHNHIHESEQPIFWHINHPNWKKSINAEQLAAVKGAHGVEIMNASSGCLNDGNGKNLPSVEQVWDTANMLRLKEGLPLLYGCTTDDTHDYDHEGAKPGGMGLAWVMVRSQELTPDAITEAMRQGNFYCSTGIELKILDFDAGSQTLVIEVIPEQDVNYTISIIGCTENETGKVLKTVEGRRVVYKMDGSELFVRARIECDEPPVCAYDEFGDIVRKAWTQPVGWK